MGTALTGLEIKDTYDGLVKTTDNGPLSGTAKYLSDGLGNDSVVALSTSRVGINTATPAQRLNVKGSSGDGIALTHSNNTIIAELIELSGVQGAGMLLKNSTGTTNILLNAGGESYINGGNVGIGTSSPYTSLTIGTSDATSEISSGGSNTHLTLKTVGASGALRFFTIGGGTSTLATTESMRITSAGNVGIGTTATSTAGNPKLQVNGSVSKETQAGAIANAATITLFTLTNNGVFLVTTMQNDDVAARSTTCLIFTESSGTTTRQVDLATGSLWTVSMSGLSVQLTNTSLQTRGYSASILQLF